MPVPPVTWRAMRTARSFASLPVQGTRDPWTVPQNYVLDLIRMRRARVSEDVRFDVPPEPRVSGRTAADEKVAA